MNLNLGEEDYRVFQIVKIQIEANVLDVAPKSDVVEAIAEELSRDRTNAMLRKILLKDWNMRTRWTQTEYRDVVVAVAKVNIITIR